MIRRSGAIAVGLMSAVGLHGAGCTTEPHISLADQGALSLRSPTAISGGVGLTITNPGELEIELLEYHYTVAAAGGSWSGRHAGSLVLSPGVDRQAMLPLVVLRPPGGWLDGRPPESVKCTVSGSLVYIGNGVFDETLAELGYRPSANFSGVVVLRGKEVVGAGPNPSGPQVVRAGQAAGSN